MYTDNEKYYLRDCNIWLSGIFSFTFNTIISVDRCSSSIGKHGFAQLISLANYCVDTEGIIIHELFHALGLHHTHARLDRNSYISVDSSKVNTG